ncbi:phosphoglucosamine mutase [candidate division KSB1 bacterium]|nr:phosphoglucosamine mutase [candidate division KSB1 bacterium]
MSKLMVSVSGVRGIVGQGLTPVVVTSFAQAFGAYVKSGKVVVGRDSRVSGEMFKSAVFSGLMAVGCDILDIGVCPTPTTQLAVETLEANGGLMITASHNPIMWNGLKLIGPDGLFLDAEQGQEVIKIAESKSFPFAAWDKIGISVKYSKAIEEHLQAILNLEYIDLNKIKERRFKVVLDCVCGSGSNMVPQLLNELGCEVVLLNCEPTGLFPRNPEPVPENLTELCEAVKKETADIGIAVDPDSDRLALVSEKGEPLGEEKTLALAVKFMLGKKSGSVVINASTSRMTEDIAEQHGSSVVRTKVGEIHVAKKMREIGAVIGGEGNGGVILPDIHLGRDAPVGIALILQQLAEFGGTIRELNDTLPNYVITKDKVELQDLEPKAALEKIQQAYSNEKLDFTDGVKIVRDKSWVHIRPSNTEPIIRVIAEAPTKEESEQLCAEVKKRVMIA